MDKSVAVIGFARTGRALLDFLIQQNHYEKIYLYDDRPISDVGQTTQYQNQGVTFLVGEDLFPQLEQADLVILSPGVDGKAERFSRLRELGIPILSELEFASRYIRVKVVAVTGTNGKSTTVSLIHHILSKNGLSSVLAGNIGEPVIGQVDRANDADVLVLEVSSFQLEEIDSFKPNVAVLLNITPDHMDRYGTMLDYVETKLRLFQNQDDGDCMILNYDDPNLREVVAESWLPKRIWFSTRGAEKAAAILKGDVLTYRGDDSSHSISLAKNPLVGLHNRENVVAAMLVALELGLSEDGIADSIADFKGLPHRMESLGRIGPVEFINDSKATNPDATLKSITSIQQPMILILGGSDKGSDFTILSIPIRQRATKVLLMGKSAGTIRHQLEELDDLMEPVGGLADAISRGYELLKETGGVVLLAPGCASFDMFENFEHRGEVFREEYTRFKSGQGLYHG